jgi:hypothetical protein
MGSGRDGGQWAIATGPIIGWEVRIRMLQQIRQEILQPFYQQNFANDGVRFVAWYLHRVLRRDPAEIKLDITDGPDDKQIDAIVVDNDERRVLVIQGKFLDGSPVGGEPLREVLAAWTRLQDLPSLQRDCNNSLRNRLEDVRQAIEDEFSVEFELLTTGALTDGARSDLDAFAARLDESDDLSASLQLVDTEVLKARLAEADAQKLPSLDHNLVVNPARTLSSRVHEATTILTLLPLSECLRLPGIRDGRLFRKNVRQSLGHNNKVNRGLRDTLQSDRVGDFFFYHNGITALCNKVERVKPDMLSVKGMSVVNGCQSLTTLYSASERVRSQEAKDACILFRLYEIPDRNEADRISISTNSQSAVKARDLRSNDKVMVGLKRAYEARYLDGCMLTKRGEDRPAEKDAQKTIDVAVLARMLMAWHCQRPNTSYNEKKLFDENYKVLFRIGYNPESMLALQTWLNAVDDGWSNLTMNDVLKAGRSYVKYHVLFSISAIISHVNGQPQLVVEPRYTLAAAARPGEILPLAATCLDNALNAAVNSAQVANRVFSPQNWLKTIGSVQGELLVASTLAGLLPSMPNGQVLRELLRVPSQAFNSRWTAE